MLHRFDDDPFRRQLQLSELRLVTSSSAAGGDELLGPQNYVGLRPFGERCTASAIGDASSLLGDR